MKKNYFLAAIILLFITTKNSFSQDVMQSGNALMQQSALGLMGGTKSNNTQIQTTTQNSANPTVGANSKIGVTTQKDLGNVNSPSIENGDSSQAKELSNKLDEKNQFQIFVFETTGRNLELYGHSLFKRTQYSNITQVPAPVNYVIGPGDEIDIKVWGSVEFNIRQQVDRDGRITLPQVGSFGVAGSKVDNLDEILKKNIGRIYKGFQVSGTLSKIKTIQIYIVGNAKKPGSHTVSGMSTLISAIFDAEGPSQYGSMRNIRLIRDGKQISKIDLYDFIKNGGSANDMKLITGDVIQFPSVGKRIAMLGAIDGQAIYELSEQEESLGALLNFMGEKNTLISRKKILIDRISNDDIARNRSVEEFPYSEEGLKTKLNDGDIVTLLKINQQYSNAVTLKGNVAFPLRYKFSKGMKISDLIPEPDALIQDDYFTKKNMEVMRIEEKSNKESLEKVKQNASFDLNEINWTYAVIERLDKQEIKINLIPFNLEKAVKEKDPKHDIELREGDSVVIFSNKEIQIPQARKNIFVKISGEVNAPGLYQIKRGESLIDLLKHSGGLTRDAYIYGTYFTRESTKKLQQDNLKRAINRVESDINSQSVSSIQNNLNQETLLASQQALASQKNFLNKLKTVEPSGRIVLEMNPEEPKYPEIILENGDEILVPSKPSFISVFGSVYAESTYLYRHNVSVKDYLAKAGLARESDVNSVMVIRADASIDSDNKNSGFFSKSVMDMKLYPGDTIFVPEAFDRRTSYTQFMQGAKDWTTILYQFGIGAAAWKTLKN